MRTLKFRCYDKVNKEFVSLAYGTSLTPSELEARDKGDQYEITQWTGLTDKAGVEIYEGDIVTVTTNHIADLAPNLPETTSIVEVKFERAMFLFGDMTMNYGGLARAKLEVIGNIYSNPELIGGTDDTPRV